MSHIDSFNINRTDYDVDLLRNIGVNEVNTLSDLPVTKRTIYATLSDSSDLSIQSGMNDGEEIAIICKCNNKFEQIFNPNSTYKFITDIGVLESILCQNNTMFKIHAIKLNNNYIIDLSNTIGAIKRYNVTFDITPPGATVKYSIGNESLDQTTTGTGVVRVPDGQTIYYEISAYGYVTQSDHQTITDNTRIERKLELNTYNVTFNITPLEAESTVRYSIDKTGYGDGTVSGNGGVVQIKHGQTIYYEISAYGYVTQSDHQTITDNARIERKLELNTYNVTFNITPPEATVNYSIDKTGYGDGTVSGNGGVVQIKHGQTIYYQLISSGFDELTRYRTITNNTEIKETMVLSKYLVHFNEYEGVSIYYSINDKSYSNAYTGPITVENGSTVYWRAFREGYHTKYGEQPITEPIYIDIGEMIIKTFTVTFNIIPKGSTVEYSINKTGYKDGTVSGDGGTVTVEWGKYIFYRISNDVGYEIISRDAVLIIDNLIVTEELHLKTFNITFSNIPDDATVYYSINSSNYGNVYNGSPFVVSFGHFVYWKAVKNGYYDKYSDGGVQIMSSIAIPIGEMSIKSYNVQFTNISSDATVYYSIDNSNYDNVYSGSFSVVHGSTVYWKAVKTGYHDVYGKQPITEPTTIRIDDMIIKTYTVTFDITPSDATVEYSIDNEEQYDHTTTGTGKVTINHGSTIRYWYSKYGYISTGGAINRIQRDELIKYELKPKEVSIDFNVKGILSVHSLEVRKSISIGDDSNYVSGSTFKAPYGSIVYWKVEHDRYYTNKGTINISTEDDITIETILIEKLQMRDDSITISDLGTPSNPLTKYINVNGCYADYPTTSIEFRPSSFIAGNIIVQYNCDIEIVRTNYMSSMRRLEIIIKPKTWHHFTNPIRPSGYSDYIIEGVLYVQDNIKKDMGIDEGPVTSTIEDVKGN